MFFLILLVLVVPARSSAGELCVYVNEQGVRREVKSLRQVPPRLRSTAQCLTAQPTTVSGSNGVSMASPKELTLEGSLRKTTINSALGPIHLRWPRTAEEKLGKDPMRATADAARMVSKALKQKSFPPEIRRLNLEWDVVFMDEKVPLGDVPMYLITNLHPAWMTPPANIYIVVERIASICGGDPAVCSKVADAKMAEVLAHEMGHAIEAQILGQVSFAGERWRAEGFATFFERIACDYSTVIPSGAVRREHQGLAQQSFQASPEQFTFDGSGQAYARASMYLEAVADERGIKGLMRVYDRLKGGEGSVLQAISDETGWSQKQLEGKARALAVMP